MYSGVFVLYDLGLYAYKFGDVDGYNYCINTLENCDYYDEDQAPITSGDVVTWNTPDAFWLIAKQYATNYVGEAVYGSFSIDDVASSTMDDWEQFGFNYIILEGTCDGEPTSVDDCTWDESAQVEWAPSELLYDADANTFEWLMFPPSSVTAGEYYQLIVYGYDHWNS